jgi:signal transduction histidine kinase
MAACSATPRSRDITERRETQLRAARGATRAGAEDGGIGQLTGGVAHGFNNLLTVIIGNLETTQRTLQSLPADAERLGRSVDNAIRGAQRAASLTQRLLAFSRRSPLEPKPVDLSRLVTGMSELLRRTLGEQIAIEAVLAVGRWRAHADPTQLEVSILNLAVNARDAMPDGGKLTIETANVYLDEAYAASQVEVVPGQYVVVSITDTGSGMTHDVLARACEPFYTTKDIGHGTGLGLSQVYGFVKQSGGNVKIYSEIGQARRSKSTCPACIRISTRWLPGTSASVPKSSSGQTILVVEDEEDVRAHEHSPRARLPGARSLHGPGCSSHARGTGREALFTDVRLPAA